MLNPILSVIKTEELCFLCAVRVDDGRERGRTNAAFK